MEWSFAALTIRVNLLTHKREDLSNKQTTYQAPPHMKQTIAIIATIVGVLVIAGIWALTTSNQEVRLRNLAATKQDESRLVFDKTWKTVKSQGKVADKYTEELKKLVLGTMEGRYGSDGSKALASFIHEQNPTLDSAIFNRLMTTIEANQAEFLQAQKGLREVKNQHDNLRTTAPSSWVIGGRPELKVILVTSDATEDAFNTGVSNDTNPFSDK